MTDLVRPIVLLVENEAIIRMDLAAELEAHGFAVLEAACADSAISLARSQLDLHAAVVDLGIDGEVTGFDLVHALRRDRPDLRVIIASGHRFNMPGGFAEPVVVERKPYDPAKIAVILGQGGA